MICDSKCCRRSGEKIWCKKNLGLKGLNEMGENDGETLHGFRSGCAVVKLRCITYS